MREKMETVKL